MRTQNAIMQKKISRIKSRLTIMSVFDIKNNIYVVAIEDEPSEINIEQAIKRFPKPQHYRNVCAICFKGINIPVPTVREELAKKSIMVISVGYGETPPDSAVEKAKQFIEQTLSRRK